MASTEAHNEGVLWSTPIRSRHDSGYQAHDAFTLSIDLSPIRKEASGDNKLLAFSMKARTLGNRAVKKANRKLFIQLLPANKTVGPEQIDSTTESICKTADSRIQSENSSDSESRSLNHYLKSFPTSLEIIRKNGNCNSEFYQPYKYICKESLNQHESSKSDVCSSQLLDKNNNTVDYVSQVKKSIHGIDFLYKLQCHDYLFIISQILSYLPDEDLTKASYVSKDWQNIIFSDMKANKRRTDYINNRRNITRGPNKENRFQTKGLPERSHKSVCVSIINASNEVSQQPLYNNSAGKFDSFYQEAQTPEDNKLMKCPSCKYPSRVESGNKYCCTRTLCRHEFCQKCSAPYLDNHICSELKFEDNPPCIFICSKNSKKYLRRL